MIAALVVDHARYARQACLMNDCESVWESVKDYFKGDEDKAGKWFTTNNALLGGLKPVTMVVLNRGPKLKKFVDSQIEENSLS